MSSLFELCIGYVCVDKNCSQKIIEGYVIIMEVKNESSIKCFTCDKKSYNLNDIKNLYCPYCKKFHDEKK